MQRKKILFIVVKALYISSGFPAPHQELKNCTCGIGYMLSLLAVTASGSSKQAQHILDAVYIVSEFLMMGGKTD
jgi:hypothetical protein